jgi:short-subunit dehydrogenase
MAWRKLAGLRVLITGASQGIGRALALAAAQRGARVLASARSADLLTNLAADVRAAGGEIETVVGDVTNPEDRRTLVETAQRVYGGLDVLINNAGIGATGHFCEASPERLRTIMEVNVFALIEMTRACLPLLYKGKTPAIVNISSIAGKVALPARSEYSASKFAVQGFSEALRAELNKDGIDVVIVSPGLTQTNFSQNMLEQKARMAVDHMRGMTAEAVAQETLRALERGSPETSLSMAGKLIVLFKQYAPWFVSWVIRRKVRSLFREEIQAREAKMEDSSVETRSNQQQPVG